MGFAWYTAAVEHDPEAAALAASRLALAASAVGEALGSLDAGVAAAVDGWSGRSRQVFDGEVPRVVDAGHALVGELLAVATAVRARSEAAQAEEVRRAGLAAAEPTASPLPGLTPLVPAGG